MSSHPTARLGPCLLSILLVAGEAMAAPLSNAAFAGQVREWRARFSAEESAVGSAALLCANLPPHRSAEEPRCVALNLHLRAQDRRSAVAPSVMACARSALADAVSEIVGRTTGSA